MNSALAALLICSLILYTQGQPLNGFSRCLCKNGFAKTPGRFLRLMTDVKVYFPSNSCPQTEITFKIKNKSYCMDPASPAGKAYLNKKLQRTTSTTTSTSASTGASTSASTGASTGSPPSSTQARRQTTALL